MEQTAVEWLSNILFVIIFILMPIGLIGLVYVSINDFLDEFKNKQNGN